MLLSYLVYLWRTDRQVSSPEEREDTDSVV